MSQDERGPLQVDDGEIHEWLDGELGGARAAELEALVHSSPQFAQRVAEARGLIAASSRILGALDDVPAGVLPRTSAPSVVVPSARASSATNKAARRWSVRRLSGLAALLMVGVTGVVVARREPALIEPARVPATEAAPTADMAASSMSGAAQNSTDSIPNVVQRDAVGSAERAPARSARTEQAAPSRTFDAIAANASPVVPTAPSMPVPVAAAAPTATAKASELQGAEVARLSAALIGVDSQIAVQTDVQGGRPLQRRAAPLMSGATRSLSGSPLGASDTRSADAVNVDEVQSDVLPSDLLLGVQRVQCAPNCVQLRIEVARDGRLRRWVQSLGSSTTADTATLSATALASLAERVAALQLDTLPAVLRLDGTKCRTVGSLRESLRVSFVHNNAPRQVMGLPWCTDGNHVLDRAAQAIEEAATITLR